ncbi:uncharacterized protein ATC70_000258 [Mucor velutinosus]|uniref:Reverse transcriptase domain-containing protein n=1 Tax=Mucor velutinosus TaxID=708070 RepID=A0AAN7DLN6_9FUNG|nr:hypothetical protein ATC70_000258 [Mucor velutinosus]
MNILCLQETHSADPEVQDRLDIQLQAKTSIWTHYCGVVSINPAIQLDDAYVSTNGRLIICTVSHVNHLFRSFRLMNIYAPATSYARYDFYADLLQLPYFRSLLSNLLSDSFTLPSAAPDLIVGDFNYNFRHFPASVIQDGLQHSNFITNLHLDYCYPSDTYSINPEDPSNVPILDSNDSANMPPATRAQWLWHAMLQHHYQECSHRLQSDPLLPTFTGGGHRSTIDYIKRNRILRTYKSTAIWNDRLPAIEEAISTLQQEITEHQALRLGLRWRENGEISPGFLKRLVTQRITQRTLPTLVDPSSGNRFLSQSEKEQAVHSFYTKLYTPDTVNTTDIHYFANMIPPSHRLSDDSHDSLCAPFTLDDILDGLFRSPPHSSPGIDGLPYQIMRLLFLHPTTAAIGLRVFNDALLHGIFPASWIQTSLVLLPKKGDLSYLKNWRPISLINTDAKTFTRILNARLMVHFSDKICIQQMGFMPQRFIAEQGLQVQCMQTIATKSGLPFIALLLDQEKAYDRIHFSYLEAIMKAFNIPSTLITAILNLFSSTMIQPNVNGFPSTPLSQLRGLRHGDPLSPLLFNIAFDPFLRAVHNDSRIQGITSWHDNSSTSALNYLGYGLFSNQQQRSSLVASLISSIQDSCQLHSTRNLTIRGRITVLNSLILSKLWHILRLVTLTKSEFSSIQSIISSFINRNAKISRFALDKLALPRSQGGLKLLIPAQQAHALQWRWLQPLLDPNQPSLTLMPSLPILRSTMSFVLGSPRFPSYHWPLLFPPCRPSGFPDSGPVHNILSAVDSIQRNFYICSVDIPTILRLPFFNTLYTPSHPLSPTFSPPSTVLQNHITIRRHLYGSDIFDYSPTTLNLTLKQHTRNLPHSIASARAINMILSHSLLLNTFTLHAMMPYFPRPLLTSSQLDLTTLPTIDQLHPLLTSLISSQFDLASHQVKIVAPSTKGFKSLPSSTPVVSPAPVLTPTRWKTFWSLRIPLNARNTWFRVLHHKISTRERIQSRLKTPFNATCTICNSSTETTEHFLFACPLKRFFWRTAILTYMLPRIQQDTYSNFQQLLHLEHPSSRHQHPLFPSLSVHQVFACMLQTVWYYHYQHHFHQSTFLPSILLSYLRNSLTTLHSQENFHQIL